MPKSLRALSIRWTAGPASVTTRAIIHLSSQSIVQRLRSSSTGITLEKWIQNHDGGVKTERKPIALLSVYPLIAVNLNFIVNFLKQFFNWMSYNQNLLLALATPLLQPEKYNEPIRIRRKNAGKCVRGGRSVLPCFSLIGKMAPILLTIEQTNAKLKQTRIIYKTQLKATASLQTYLTTEMKVDRYICFP